MANPGPASQVTVNTQPVRGDLQFINTIGVTLTPAAVATITTVEQSFGANGVTFATAATGLLAGDVILAVNPPSTVAGVSLASFRVDTSVNDKFYVTFVNPTAGSVTPAAGVYVLTVARFNQSNTTTPGTLSSLPTTLPTT